MGALNITPPPKKKQKKTHTQSFKSNYSNCATTRVQFSLSAFPVKKNSCPHFLKCPLVFTDSIRLVRKIKCRHVHPLTKVRVLKTWENGFPHSHLWASYSLSLNAVQKKTINSTLKFSIRRRVKLWDNCLDLINKRNGSNSWPRTGEQQLEVHIWMGFTFNHHRTEWTEWTEWTAEVTKLTRTKMFFLPFLLWMHSLYEQFVFCF